MLRTSQGWESRETMAQESVLRRITQAEFDCNPRAFRRAAVQRLEAARFLLDSEAFLDAVYLAGYVVECALKALILERTPVSKRGEACRELTSGARAHNFDVLSGLLKVKGCTIPDEIEECLASLADQWRTDLRYVGTFVPRREAERFIDQVRSVYEWMQRS
jgi:HEPN domain-containing protein